MENFPDWYFNKSDWQEITLSEVCEIFTGTANNKNIFDNDILVTKDGTIGKIAIAPNFNELKILNSGIFILKTNSKIVPKFFYYILMTQNFRKFIEIFSAGTAIKHLYKPDLQNFKFKVPPLEEQKKIGEYFTNLDDSISSQEIKLTSWRKMKKELLQKIFSHQYFFTDSNGQKYPTWQEKTLGEIAEFLSGLTYSPENVSNTGTIVFRSQNIQNDFINYEKILRVNISNKKLPQLKENDILMCVRNGSKKLVGKTALISKKDLGNTWGAFMMIIRSKENNNFLYQYFKTELFYREIFEDIGTTTINQITKGMLNNCKLKIPCLEEQKKIANYFTTLDSMIDAENKILENLRRMKKELLRKLFV